MKKLDTKVDKLLPIVSNVVQGVKKAIEYKNFDMIVSVVKNIIPGTADDLIIDKVVGLVREHLPKIALQLQIVTSIADTEEPREQLIKIFAELQNVSDETWAKFCSQLAQQLLIDMADNKITWGEAGVYMELYYKTYIKNKTA
jgi:hypothetical protein